MSHEIKLLQKIYKQLSTLVDTLDKGVSSGSRVLLESNRIDDKKLLKKIYAKKYYRKNREQLKAAAKLYYRKDRKNILTSKRLKRSTKK